MAAAHRLRRAGRCTRPTTWRAHSRRRRLCWWPRSTGCSWSTPSSRHSVSSTAGARCRSDARPSPHSDSNPLKTAGGATSSSQAKPLLSLARRGELAERQQRLGAVLVTLKKMAEEARAARSSLHLWSNPFAPRAHRDPMPSRPASHVAPPDVAPFYRLAVQPRGRFDQPSLCRPRRNGCVLRRHSNPRAAFRRSPAAISRGLTRTALRPRPRLICGRFVPDAKKAVGGHVLAHASDTRISLRKGKGDTRVGKITDSPWRAEQEAMYMITEGGINDATE